MDRRTPVALDMGLAHFTDLLDVLAEDGAKLQRSQSLRAWREQNV